MNSNEIRRFLLDFCEATQCHVDEQGTEGLTVKLSDDVDRLLTNRPYYWMFVDRGGTAGETLRMKWLMAEAEPQSATQALQMPRLDCRFGARGLQHIFRIAQDKGRFVRLFEQPTSQPVRARSSRAYQTWACFNLKTEYICDLKREQLTSIGVHLQTGRFVDSFAERLAALPLQTQLPQQTHLLREIISLEHAWRTAIDYCRRAAEQATPEWAEQARRRMADELAIHRAYLEAHPVADREQAEHRLREIEWQYKPHVRISLVNGGLFHISAENSISHDV